jgi:ligand-binding sensor domain-containing protein/signal transduction histidine kinase
MKPKFPFSFVIVLLLPLAGMSQRFYFEKISESDGLSDNRVTCFMKDRAGFMWIGTENGLNRYDGHDFRIYRPGQKNFNLSHEHINDIEQDSKGRLWVATWSGLNVLNVDRDSLYIFSPDHDIHKQKKTTIPSTLIWDTFIDAKERVWIAADVRDLSYYDQQKDEFVTYPWMDFVRNNLPATEVNPYSSIQKIIPKSDHEIWLGTTRGLFSFDINTKTFRFHGGDELEDCAFVFSEGDIDRVIFGQKNLYLFDASTNKLQLLTIKTTEEEVSNHDVIAPSVSGLWNIDVRKLTAAPLVIHEKDPFTLHHKNVKAVFNDNGTYWIGTYDGIRIHNKNLELFRFTGVFSDTVRARSGNVYHVFDHEKNNQYILTSYTKNRLIIIDKKTGTRKEITHISGKPLYKPSRLYLDKNNRLWLLSANAIYYSDDHKTFSIFPYPKENNDYLFNDMLHDKEGNYWFAALRYGVFFFNTKSQSWRLLRHKPDGLFASRPTRLLADDAQNAIWISDFSFGVFRYDMATKKFKYHGMDSDNKDFLQSSLSNDIILDKNGDMWVATNSGGVSRYDQKKQIFITYSMETGLPENTINAIECDTHGNLWLLSHKGLTHIKTDGQIIKHYDQNSGLPFTNFTTPISKNSKGELFIGAGHGFIQFHPDSLSISLPDFPIAITTAAVSGVSILDSTNVSFPYDQNELTVSFSALTYFMPEKVTYLYKLDGYDKKWNTAIDRHEINYTNLDHGRYRFLVKALDQSGKQSVNVASVHFIIGAPFWKRWWFYGLIIIAGVTTLYFWIQSLQRRIRSHEILNQVATSLYNQRTYEEVFWTVARNCVELLHFEDCVIYLLDERGVLIQKAAAGPKILEPYQISNPIEIPLGKGIVGTVAHTGMPEVIFDTTRDKRYIVDDTARMSEISVPIIVDGKVFGVIDSENSRRGFYTRWHLKTLLQIASICSAKISRYFVEEQIRSKVARDLHDDMGSSLSSINIMSKIALEKNEPLISNNYLKVIRENAALMQESLSDIVWAINPQNDTMEKVLVRMKEFAAELCEPLNIQYDFIEEGDLSIVKLDINTRKDFYLIFKESINNAVKYSECNRITVHMRYQLSGLVLRINDDGKGFDLNVKRSGNGLKNMKHRADTIHGQLKIESEFGSGTQISLMLPSSMIVR